MEKQEIYRLIEEERLSQDAKWRQGRSNEGQYSYSASHVLLILKLASKLEDEWYSSKYEDFRDRFIKIAATAVRALEEINIG